MYKLKRIFVYIRVFIETVAAEIVGLFFKRNEAYQNLWIVSERGMDARDNGYHFFKFLRTHHPEINSVYIITKDSPDRPKVSSLGTVIDYGSFKHYLCFIFAKVKASTHIDGYSPDILFFNKFGKLFPDKSKKIFLQHGITKDNLGFCRAEHTNIDMFACGAVPEYEYVKDNFGYKPGIVQLVGLCRFDNLQKADHPTKKMLFMPTWRSSLRTCNKTTFAESEYYKKYESFLQSKKLYELLEEYDYELVFYPHYEVHRFLDCFSTFNPRISIADFRHYDVQDLLINTDILITDYSSVFFDYGYMRKPIVYYQYDEASFRAEQYGEGYFEYKRDSFGDVVETEDEVIESIRHILENDLRPDDVYLEKMNAFFNTHGKNNCQRTFDAICKMLNE